MKSFDISQANKPSRLKPTSRTMFSSNRIRETLISLKDEEEEDEASFFPVFPVPLLSWLGSKQTEEKPKKEAVLAARVGGSMMIDPKGKGGNEANSIRTPD